MTEYKWFVFVLIAALGLIMSCGDDETGPSSNPTASTLSVSVSNTTASGSWTICPDDDFAEYNLYRDTSPGVSASSDLVRGSVTNINDNTFSDPGLEWGVRYYYALQTKDTEGLDAWSNEESVTPDSGGGGGGGEYLSCYEIQGQASSSPYEGEEVEVAGIVTVAGDCFYGDPVAVIGDPSGGPWAGLTLFGDSIAYLARGDSVIVSGTVGEFFGMTQIEDITSVEVVSSGNPLPPSTIVTTGDISQSADPEQYESVLVTVTDAVVTEVLEFGQWTMDDGTGDCMGDDLGTFTWNPAVEDTVFSATGVMWYSYSEWMLEPRDNADLDVSSGGSGEVLTSYEVQGQQSSSPYEGQVVSVTGIVVVGGDEYYSSQYAYAVIMDEGGGAWAGLTLFGSDVASFARGDSITITGEIQEYYGFTELAYPTAVEVHSTGHTLPAAEALATGDVGDEQWESVLVSVSDVTVTEDDLGYGEWAVDDASGDIRIDDMGDYSYEPVISDTFAEITGVCFYSYDNWKIEPRDDSDLIE